eukprot:SAG11_NODE_1342_length_5154_cov_2.272404_4_plen_183_part_00
MLYSGRITLANGCHLAAPTTLPPITTNAWLSPIRHPFAGSVGGTVVECELLTYEHKASDAGEKAVSAPAVSIDRHTCVVLKRSVAPQRVEALDGGIVTSRADNPACAVSAGTQIALAPPRLLTRCAGFPSPLVCLAASLPPCARACRPHRARARARIARNLPRSRRLLAPAIRHLRASRSRG